MGRRLGQHFLRDPAILSRIVEALGPAPGDQVLEIGPGEGTLTRHLVPRVGSVVAIERDPALASRTRDALAAQGVRVVAGDALEQDWHDLLAPGPFKLIGNLPYYITSPLLEKALEPPRPAVAVFLVQKEVAERVSSPPGSKVYGALSVGVQAVAAVEKLFTVRAGAFSPPPEVDSAVLRLTPRSAPVVMEEERPGFRRFVAALFSRRRKQLRRTLQDVGPLTRETVEAALTRLGIDPTARPEVLTVQQLAETYRVITELTGAPGTG